MRLTKILCKQHMARFIRRHWYIQSNRTIQDDGIEKFLKAKGIKILDPKEFLYPKKSFEKTVFPSLKPVPLKEDSTHPDWHDSPCFLYEDNDLLVQGIPQARILTKTIQLEEESPQRIENLVSQCSQNIHDLVLRSISSSNLFDAHQELLPVVKDPERPAWNFPRYRGITSARKSYNLLHKLLQLCESINGAKLAYQRSIIDNGIVSFSTEKDLDFLQFNLSLEMAVTSESPLLPFLETNFDEELPNLHPMHHCISLRTTNIYQEKQHYLIDWNHSKPHLHTILIHHDPVEVKNKTELPTEETQVLARNMLKAFTAAASCARKRFGDSVEDLPEPVSIQCIQTEGETFHFSVYQLNTLNLNGRDGLKNYWWSSKRLRLFDQVSYVDGKPLMEGYNPEVFARINAFYNNN